MIAECIKLRDWKHALDWLFRHNLCWTASLRIVYLQKIFMTLTMLNERCLTDDVCWESILKAFSLLVLLI